VMVSVCIVAAVVRVLTERNDLLVAGLHAEARIDPLTGLLNRRGFDERVQSELARVRRAGDSLAVVSLLGNPGPYQLDLGTPELSGMDGFFAARLKRNK